MKCEYCDNVILDNVVVCPHCGAPISGNTQKVVKVISTTNHKDNVEENDGNKMINKFLYGVIVFGIILIIAIIFLRFK